MFLQQSMGFRICAVKLTVSIVTKCRWGCLPPWSSLLQRQVLIERKVVHFQVPATWKMGDSGHKAQSHISVEAEIFIRRERGTEQIYQGRRGVEKFSTCRWAQSIPIRLVMVRCAASWFSRPGFLSSQLHVILDPWLKVSKFPRAHILKDWSLYLLKLVPRILIQTCCLLQVAY